MKRRYEDGGEVDALEAANQSQEAQDIANQTKGEAMLIAMRDEAAKPKAAPRPKPAMPKAEYSNEGRSVPAPVAKPVSATTKAKTAQAGRDAEMAARREKTMGAIKGFGSFLSELPGKAMENYRSTVPRYNKEKKMASGGKVNASSRADGIAQRGKTKGTMVMCGGGYTKGKK